MPVPLALAAPAAAAGLLYLNAKSSFTYDLRIFGGYVNALVTSSRRERNDRLNSFYILEQHALDKKVADHVFLIFEGRRWTYKQVYETALKYGTWLKKTLDVKPKEIVAMDFENSDKFIFIFFGLWSIGARPAFINYSLSGKALAHCIRVSTARIALIDPHLADEVTDEVSGELPNVKFVVFTSQLEADAMTISAIREPDSVRSCPKLQEVSMLIYTSGTTGLPKPAVISWNKNIVGSLAARSWTGINRSDIFYTCMPLYHSSAAILGLLNVLEAGATLSLGRKFSTRRFWQDVRESDSTVIQYVGETCRYLLSAPPHIGPSGENLDKKNNVRMAFGNGLRPDIWTKFKERFGIETIAEFYSASEATGGTINYSRNEFSRGAIGRSGWLINLALGRPILVEHDFDTEAPKRNSRGFCTRLSYDVPGELIYELDANDIEKKFQGYFGNKEATSSKVIKDVFKKGDAYFRTGDVVRLNADGLLYFVDRIGDTFRWKSENVSTNEVAERLSDHPSILEANVYGVELPHHDGRAGCAALVLHELPSPHSMSSLAEHARRELPRFAVPLFLRITKSIQTTGTNKQQKHLLRSLGVDPGNLGDDELYWLKNGVYVRFGSRDWQELNAGKIKL